MSTAAAGTSERGVAAPPAGAGLGDLVANAVLRHPQQELVIDGERLSYAEMARQSSATAAALRERGLRPGDVVMTLCSNGLPLVATWWACFQLGAVFAPLHDALEGSPLAGALARAGGAVLVCDSERWRAVAAASDDAPRLRHVLVARGAAARHPALRVESLDHVIGSATSSAAAAARDLGTSSAPPLDDRARLLFTSGTTGDSKLVVWSRRAEALHAMAYGDELVRIEPGDTVYSCLPLFHVTCQGTFMGALLHGGRLVIDRRFDPLRFWARTRDEGAVFFPYVGTMISALLSRRPRRDDADNPVRRAMGSAAPAARWEEFEQRFGMTLDDVWGQSETASCWTLPASDGAHRGSVGSPCDRFEARVAGPDGAELPMGHRGELWIRPRLPHVICEGYLSEDGTVEPVVDDHGWYHTGDLLSADEGDRLTFHGRLRESIRRRGETIAPADIEAVAMRHPAVAEAAAVAVAADDGVEDEILLWVVVRHKTKVTAAEVHRHLAGQLPKYLTPRYIRFADSLPKTATTRIRRAALRERGREGAWDARAARRWHDG